jgi:hypothetical protein
MGTTAWVWPGDVTNRIFLFLWRKEYDICHLHMFHSVTAQLLPQHGLIQSTQLPTCVFLYDGPLGEEKLSKAVAMETQYYLGYKIERGDVVYFTGRRGCEQISRLQTMHDGTDFYFASSPNFLTPVLSRALFYPEQFGSSHLGALEWASRVWERHSDGTFVWYHNSDGDGTIMLHETQLSRDCTIYSPDGHTRSEKAICPYLSDDWHTKIYGKIEMDYTNYTLSFPNGMRTFLNRYACVAMPEAPASPSSVI